MQSMRIVFVALVGVPVLVPAQQEATARSGGFVFDSTAITVSGARTLSEFLAGRVPHLVVRQTSGVAGAGSRVRIRGLSTWYGSPNPVLIIDGVRVDAQEGASLSRHAAAAPSRMDDVRIADVSRVEVFHGPAAAARYGYGTTAGVIAITTRVMADTISRTWWRAGGGTSSNIARYPLNYRMLGTLTADGSATDACPLQNIAAGICTAGELHSGPSLIPGEVFAPAQSIDVSGGVSGVMRGARFAAAGGWDRDEGILPENWASQVRGSIGAARELGRSGRLAIGVHHWSSDVRFPDDNAMRLPFMEPPVGELPPPYETFYDDDPAIGTQQHRRSLLTTQLNGSLPGALRWRVQAGKEWSRTHDHWSYYINLLNPEGIPVETQGAEQGARDQQRHTIDASLERDLRLPFHVARLGVHLLATRHREEVFRHHLMGSSWRLHRTNTRSVGLTYFSVLGQRAWLEGGVRREGIRTVEAAFGNRTYVNGAATLALGPRVTSRSDSIHLVRAGLRYGETADVAMPRDDIQDIDYQGRVSLVPERTYESQGSVAVHAPSDLGEAGVTLFQRRSTGVRYRVAEYGFSDPLLQYVGHYMVLRHHGIEVAGTVRPVRTRMLDGEVTAVWGLNRSRKSSRRSAFPPTFVMNPKGDDVAGVATAFGVVDLDGDGLIDRSEAQAFPDRPIFLGSQHPARSLGVNTSVRIARVVRVTALLDYAGEFVSEASTEYARCWVAGLGWCRGAQDPSSSHLAQARRLAARPNTYYENASYTRLREVVISFEPTFGILRDARISLIGRNLALWTRFDGLDPEVTRYWYSPTRQSDEFTLPVPRTIALRLDWGT